MKLEELARLTGARIEEKFSGVEVIGAAVAGAEDCFHVRAGVGLRSDVEPQIDAAGGPSQALGIETSADQVRKCHHIADFNR